MLLHAALTTKCVRTGELCDGQNCQVRDSEYKKLASV
jgi:hypothetical protein